MKPSRPARVAIGLRAHSGWAAAVAIAGPPFPPRILDRRRIEIASRKITGSVQPFHAAEPMPFGDAKKHIDECARSTRELAGEALAAIIEELRAQGHEIELFAVLRGSGRQLPELAVILRSHALIHTAEGEFFRDALEESAQHLGIAVVRYPEKTIAASEPGRFDTIAGLGRLIGPPWQQDQKLAALAAWLALEQARGPAHR